MTDRHIMTPEEAAQLPMPEGLKLTYSECDCEWLYSGDPGPGSGLAILAATVADGYFPRDVLDHAWAAHRGEEWVHNPRVAEKLKARGLRITELEQRLGYERAKRSQAEGYAEAYDSRLTRIRVALTKAGLPEVERYPDEDVSEEERQLRAGGRVIDDARRIEILADALKSAREQLADWPKERRDAAVELARLVRRNVGDVGTMQVGHICDIIDRLPAIAPCPRCGGRCSVRDSMSGHRRTECDGTLGAGCWHGPPAHSAHEAIEAHNREAALLTGGAK